MAGNWRNRVGLACVMAGTLAGCVPHSIPLYAGTAQRVTVDGSRFLVRWTDTRAEATRISPESRPQRMVILSRALRAIETVSGCTVLPGTLYGDTNLAEAYLDCPGRDPERLQPALTHRPPVTTL